MEFMYCSSSTKSHMAIAFRSNQRVPQIPMSGEPASTDASAAEKAKAAGNAAFKSGDYEAAVTHFSAAISADPASHVPYSNRSAAYAKLAKYKEALLDANKCIELNPRWARGHSRRGAAY
eukprot:6194298-Pleurochrysis_carterae.AAC.1